MMSLFGSAEHMLAAPSPSCHTRALDPAAPLLKPGSTPAGHHRTAHLSVNTHTLAFCPRTSSSPENSHPVTSGMICKNHKCNRSLALRS